MLQVVRRRACNQPRVLLPDERDFGLSHIEVRLTGPRIGNCDLDGQVRASGRFSIQRNLQVHEGDQIRFDGPRVSRFRIPT